MKQFVVENEGRRWSVAGPDDATHAETVQAVEQEVQRRTKSFATKGQLTAGIFLVIGTGLLSTLSQIHMLRKPETQRFARDLDDMLDDWRHRTAHA
jgi:hypothetical protein